MTIWQQGIVDTAGSKDKVVIETIVGGLVAIFYHAFITWLRPSIRAVTGFAVIALLVLWLYPGPTAVLTAALREAQLG